MPAPAFLVRNHGHWAGISPVLAELRREVDRVARFDASVLITGEPGVGKELVARELHSRSVRRSRPFIPLACVGQSDALVEGALSNQLQLSDGGTIFLDDVGAMPMNVQRLLLQFLETGELEQGGMDSAGTRVDVRVIAATSRPLADRMKDFFEGEEVCRMTVPALRDRKEDIPAMIDGFLRHCAATRRSVVEALEPAALEALVAYDWPGNVRELQNVIEQIASRVRGRVAAYGDLPAEVRARSPQPVAAPTSFDIEIVEELYARLTANGESFWTSVYPLYMQREITRAHVRQLIQKGLEEARGNYKIMVQLFNMNAGDYKKFLNFLRKHRCQLSFKEFRQIGHADAAAARTAQPN